MLTVRSINWKLVGLLTGLFLLSPVMAAVEDNAVLALEPQQGTVVVKTAAGTLEVIGIGDAFPGSEVIVKQVLVDKVVAEEVTGEDNRVTQTVWIYKAENPTEGSRVERLLHELPEDQPRSSIRYDQVISDAFQPAGSGD